MDVCRKFKVLMPDIVVEGSPVPNVSRKHAIATRTGTQSRSKGQLADGFDNRNQSQPRLADNWKWSTNDQPTADPKNDAKGTPRATKWSP